MKLEIEPVLEGNWGVSLANLLPRPVWDALRKEIYSVADYKCSICGAEDSTLNCHEKWLYDDKRRLQKLSGLQCLCRNCHYIKHWGRTVSVIHKGEMPNIITELTNHFCKVNRCSVATFNSHKVEISDKLQKRGKYKYTVDFGKFRPEVVIKLWEKRL